MRDYSLGLVDGDAFGDGPLLKAFKDVLECDVFRRTVVDDDDKW